MENSAARKPGAGRRLRSFVTFALLVAVLVTSSGCASSWTFGTTKWCAEGELYQDPETPRVIVLVPFIVFDLIVLPVALIHDQYPRDHSWEGTADEHVKKTALR